MLIQEVFWVWNDWCQLQRQVNVGQCNRWSTGTQFCLCLSPKWANLSWTNHEGTMSPPRSASSMMFGIWGKRLHTFGVPPLSLPTQQTECYKSHTHIGLSCCFFLQWELQIALGGSDQVLITVCSQKSVWLLLQSLIAVSFPKLSV